MISRGLKDEGKWGKAGGAYDFRIANTSRSSCSAGCIGGRGENGMMEFKISQMALLGPEQQILGMAKDMDDFG